MADLDQINVSTQRMIRKGKLVDNAFQEDPLWAYARKNMQQNFSGGKNISTNFVYDTLKGKAYQKGATFDISEKQTDEQLQHEMKFVETNVSLTLEDLEVINKGEAAAYRLLDSKMSNAYRTLGQQVAIMLYHNAQRAGYEPFFNGLAEALNDGATASWDGSAYVNYGGKVRGGKVGAALNSVPVNVGGAIEYPTLTQNYSRASRGGTPKDKPNLLVTTPLCSTYIKEKFQTQQRFNDTVDANIGFAGLKFENATIIESRFCPGTELSTITGIDAFFQDTSGGVLAGAPVVASESLFMINARDPYFTLWVSDSKLFGMGFTGFKAAQNSTQLAGQLLFSGNIVIASPFRHKALYGITG
jgi:hypothetical protein